jgi:hypothetical protein
MNEPGVLAVFAAALATALATGLGAGPWWVGVANNSGGA